MTERYEGKPFLRLLDAYVLDAIGALPPEADAKLKAMEPKFAGLFGNSGSWREMVAQRMNFPEGMAGAIYEMWHKGRPHFIAANGHEPDPAEFTRTFVDTKFPH